MIYLGADHGGFEVKEKIKRWLAKWGFRYQDLGNTVFDKDDDYPDFAAKVAKAISSSKNHDLGIMVCRSGHGIDMVANKFPNVRSALCFTAKHAQQGREHENANFLCLANDYVSEDEIKEITRTFLETKFSFGERHERRLEKMEKIEEKNFR